jgi:hypothetical protein
MYQEKYCTHLFVNFIHNWNFAISLRVMKANSQYLSQIEHISCADMCAPLPELEVQPRPLQNHGDHGEAKSENSYKTYETLCNILRSSVLRVKRGEKHKD